MKYTKQQINHQIELNKKYRQKKRKHLAEARINIIPYETTMFEQFKKDKEIVDNELSVTARKFLNNKAEKQQVYKQLNQPVDKRA